MSSTEKKIEFSVPSDNSDINDDAIAIDDDSDGDVSVTSINDVVEGDMSEDDMDEDNINEGGIGDDDDDDDDDLPPITPPVQDGGPESTPIIKPTEPLGDVVSSAKIPEMGQAVMAVDAINLDDDDSDSDSEEYANDNLQKFNDEIKKEHIAKHHPEIKLHNNNEIEEMSVCVKNSDGIVVDPLHITNSIMSKFEYTRILGIRTKQLNSGAKPFVKVPEGIVDGYLIAEKELREKKLPFIIKRPIPNGGCEYWNIKDLEIIL